MIVHIPPPECHNRKIQQPCKTVKDCVSLGGLGVGMDVMKKNSLWGNLFRKGDNWQQQCSRLWAQTPLFDGIAKREIERLVENMIPRAYQSGEFIFHDGDQGAGAALIVAGQIEIRSGEVVLARLGSGDFFGEIALVLDVPRTADAVAMEETQLLFFLQAELDEWLARAPYYAGRLSKNLANVLAQRLTSANKALARRGEGQ